MLSMLLNFASVIYAPIFAQFLLANPNCSIHPHVHTYNECRVPLYRMRRPIEKIWDMGLTREMVQWKYGSKEPKSIGDTPEPLTDYMDVSEGSMLFHISRCSIVLPPLAIGTTAVCKFSSLVISSGWPDIDLYFTDHGS